MDPIIENDWLGCKNEPVDESQHVGSIARSWQWREMGIDPPQSPSNKTVMENMAEDILVQKPLKIKCCDLPGYPRSTFLMVFSPDGTKVASTHGNHNVYVSDLASGKHVRILKGHPRTPWCIAFHPSHPQLIGSGCLGGQVRVWDLSGGSEVWTVTNETVIASIAFHPRDQLLVIATFNELYFWDWSQPAPFTKVSTNNINEKVRYVAFDSLGYKLVTGISVWSTPGGSTTLLQSLAQANAANNQANARRDNPGDNPPRTGSGGSGGQENSGIAQEMIVNSYQNLVQRYDSLVRNYQRLFMARHQLTNTPVTNTTDRGTDPMETDTSLVAGPSGWTASNARASTDNDTTRNIEGGDSGDGEGSSSRLLNLDVLSINSNPSRSAESNQNISPNRERSIFGSRSSAFQRLNDNSERSQSSDANERMARWLPNPFSSSSSSPHPPGPRSSSTSSFSANTAPLEHSANTASLEHSANTASLEHSANTAPLEYNAGSSRTSVFTSHRLDSPSARFFLQRRRNLSLSQQTSTGGDQSEGQSSSADRQDVGTRSRTSSRSTSTQRPQMTNSSTQISPVAAQTINESLDLIRDILRDSGTRLLNLITNMSLSTLASVERSMPRTRRPHASHSDDSEAGARPRPRPRPRVRLRPRPRLALARPVHRLFSSDLCDEFLSSESDSDSDRALRRDLFRRRTSSFRADNDRRGGAGASTDRARRPTDRMVVELSVNDDSERGSYPVVGDRRFNVSISNDRFRVRSHSTDENPARETNATEEGGTAAGDISQNTDTSRPSTSRDNFWTDDPFPHLSSDRGGTPMSSADAIRKVRAGVNALQKHTVLLTDIWLRGSRASMRDLRRMWENLRRRVLSLHRLTGRQDVPSYYTRGLMERCRFLTEMSRSSPRNPDVGPSRNARNPGHAAEAPSAADDARQTHTDSTSSPALVEAEQSTSAGPSGALRARQLRRAHQLTNFYKLRNALITRRRLQSSSRWREEELRRRPRPVPAASPAPRPLPRSRAARPSFELHCTRNEIRMRAMQVLSIMFNMMMSCLEERGLSQLIMHMLRMLKKALALTCLMLMTNRLNRRETENQASTRADDPVTVNGEERPDIPEERSENRNDDNDTAENNDIIVDNADSNVNTQERIPNNVTNDTNNDSNSTSSWPTSDSDDNTKANKKRENIPDCTVPSQEPMPETPSTSQMSQLQKWSNRLAVQISAANRNNSATARSRRDFYLESRRLKALHRTNPRMHPIVKRKVYPPSSTYRIPAVRRLPPKRKPAKPSNNETSEDPIAGPSTSQPEPSREDASLMGRDPSTSRNDPINDFDNRINLYRLAHMQAVRLRTAARTRLRRLQTIRLYTPSSVREMFAIQSNNNENQSGNQSSLNNSPDVNRRPFAAYRPQFVTRNEPSGGGAAAPGGGGDAFLPFESILNNVAVPLVQVNDFAVSEGQGAQPQRMPRVHEYLQPIILAQNALVVEDGSGGGGGGASGGLGGLVDAGLIPEAMPAPTHRVQAWDFTTGDTPDIADSTKNVVVQRCKIHNDASIDISKDGRLLVALLPVPRLRHTNHWLGVYSLEWGRLGQCLHTVVLEQQSAVSVALSPTGRHLAVGLGSRRFTMLPHSRNNVFGLLYRMSPLESSSRTGLSPIKELEQDWEQGFTSLNCLRWAPQPGQGLVYANNTGQLIIMS